MHIAHFIQRYPPALGGSESYFARLGNWLAEGEDNVTVWTTTAVDLEAFWTLGRKEVDPKEMTNAPPMTNDEGENRLAFLRHWGGIRHSSFGSVRSHSSFPAPPRIRRFPLLRFPGRRYVLKAASLVPIQPWQCLTMPCNPIAPGMWRSAGCDTGPVDAVHATAFPYAFPILCGLRLARRRGVPFFLTPFLHLGDPAGTTDRTRSQYTSRPLRWLLRQADRVFVQTRLERDAAVGLGVSPDRVVHQGLGVCPNECTGGDRLAARVSWGVGPGEVVVGHLANQSAEKGTIDLLKAAERVWATGHRFRIVLAGPEMPNFRAFWGGFAQTDCVVRLGVLTEKQKRDFFAGIDLFALPSRSDSFGLVLLEAWANAKPNLVYRAGGPAELIHDRVDGLQAKCGEIGELASCLRSLVTDRDARERLGSTGHARLGREFRWSDKLSVVRETIRSVSDGGGPRRGSGHEMASS